MDVALGLASRGLDDLVLLDGIDEENVQRTLESRFKNEGSMYTRIGPVLIAMNPYKILTVAGKPIYDESLIDAYRGRLYYEMPPHIFAVAEAAYTDLLRFRREQSIIISGESGAGKTEACKQCLCFISRVSGAYVQAAQQQTKPGMKAPPVSSSVAAAMRVKDRLVTSTLVLESFGNAATVRNDNSSRFGKLMTVNFKSSGMASAGSIRIYLLEKNRVVRQQEGERNFHIFHQLTAGANAEQRRQFMIQQPSAYAYLANEERKIPSVNDTNQFRAVSACFNLLCIPQDTQNTIWKVVSTVLNLGNIDFTSGQDEDKERDQRQKGSSGSVVPGGGSPQILDGADGFVDDVGTGTPSSTAKGGVINDDAAKVVDSGTSLEAQKAVATLLGVSPEDVEKALTTRTLVIRGSETQALQTTAQARTARDSLAKALYSKLFDYVVGEVNKSISGIHDGNTQPSHAAAAAKPKGKTGSVVSVASAASKASNKNTMEQTATTATAAKTGPHGDSPPPNTASLAEEESDAQAMEKVREEEEQQLRLQQQQADEEEETRNLAMHLLDLYGFEDLACNKFDQLCINYVNERLQQLFIEATLRTEQQVYEQEGIEWTPIDYFDNQIVVTLLDGKGGLFPLLDDSAAIADSSPTKLMQTLNKQLGKHPHYVAPKLANDSFTVKHYAGEISYSASAGEGMVIANRDILNNSLLALLNNSPGIPVLQELFRDKRTKEEKCKRPPTAGLQFRVSVNALIEVLSVCHPHYVRCIKPNDSKRAMAIDPERFIHQIRCLGLVESTRVKRAGFAYRSSYEEFNNRYRMLSKVTWPPKDFDDRNSVETLLSNIKMLPKPKNSALGVGLKATSTATIADAPANGAMGARGTPASRGRGGPQLPRGPTRATAGPPRTMAAAAGPPRMAAGSRGGGGAATADTSLDIRLPANTLPGDFVSADSYDLKPGQDYQLGASMIFLKEPSTLFNLEYMRMLALGKVVSKLAALWRAHKGKRDYKKIRAAWLKQQAHVKGRLLRKRFLKMKKAAIKLQAAIRGFLVRKHPEATAMREALGMLNFFGKIRRRLSLRWSPPNCNDWLGILTPGTTAPSIAASKLAKAIHRKGDSVASILYSDHVIKIKPNYKLLRRALVVGEKYLFNIHDPWQKGRINRRIAITDIEKVSVSPYRDSYISIQPRGDYAYLCICETKVFLIKALMARYAALTNGQTLQLEITPNIGYVATSKEPSSSRRGIQFRQISDPAVFETHRPTPAEAAVLMIPGGVGGGDTAGLDVGSLSIVQQAYMEAEKHRPFHDLQGDQKTLVVSVPLPRKVRLAEILTDAEKTKLQAKGFRIKT